jgi:4-amino-4-deoxy-L-arabinose transferase-like glycosyltransferase
MIVFKMIKKIDGKHWLRLTGFLLFFLMVYTWTLQFRDLYGLEIRNALIAREMLENGLTIIPRVLGHYYPDYLPLYFWMETVFSIPAGKVSTLSAVLPSALSAIGLLALTFCLARRISLRAGWLSALILATIPPFWLNAGSATIDMLLAFFVTAGIICFYFKDLENNPGRGNIYFLGACFPLVAAFMVKGPIGIVLPAVSWGGYLLWDKRIKDFLLFSLVIVIVSLICIGLELSVAYVAGGKEFVYDVIRMQVTGRLHQANSPFYYYFVGLLEIGGPWWLLITACFYVLVKEGRAKKCISHFGSVLAAHSVNRLAFLCLIGIFTIFSLAATKHARYLLPLYPAAAIILAAAVEHFLIKNNLFRTKRIQNTAIYIAGALLSVGFAFYILLDEFRFVPFGHMLIWLAAGITGIVSVSTYRKPSYRMIGSILVFLIIGLSGTNLLLLPALSRRASAHPFVSEVESLIDPQIPVVIHSLGRDGDALKYIFFSNRRGAAIRFIGTVKELNLSPESFLLVTPSSDNINLIMNRDIRKISEGHIRSKSLYAHLIGPQQKIDD